jgi:hypothetical protein
MQSQQASAIAMGYSITASNKRGATKELKTPPSIPPNAKYM